jgi:hypothetical protein
VGDRVEYVGPPPEKPGDPEPGELGWVISHDPPGEWVVKWDHAGTAVWGEEWLRPVKEDSATS